MKTHRVQFPMTDSEHLDQDEVTFYLHEGDEAPGMCPACAHPQAHFETLAENW